MAENIDGRLNFKAVIDDSEYQKTVEKMEKGISSITKETEKSVEASDDFAKSMAAVHSELERTNKKIHDFGEILTKSLDKEKGKELNKEIENTGKNAGAAGKKIEESFEKANEEIAKVAKNIKEQKFESSFFLPGSIKGETSKLNELKKALSTTTNQNEIVALNKKIQDTENAIFRLSNAGKKGFDELGNAIAKVETKKSRLSGIVDIFKQMAGAFGLLAGVGLVVSVFRNAVQSVFDFDKAMTNMSAIAGKNRKELKDVEQVIREVASTSINSANEVANLATELIKLGTSTEDVKKLIKPVNDLSIAFNASAEDSATLVKSMLNAYGQGADQAERFTDVLAAAANQTALGFQEIKEAFTYISPAAAAAGYSLEQAASMAGVLVDNGIRASSAGRLLASTLGRLAGQGTDLETSLDKVRNSSDKLATATKIFGSESGKIGIILANNKDRLKELTTGFENAEGSLAVLTEKQLQSLPAKVKMVTSAWEEFILGLDSGDGAISKATKGLLEFTAGLIGLISTQRTASKALDDERVNIGMLVGELTKANVTQAQRVALLEKINKDYPSFLINLDKDKVTNEQLASRMKEVNEQYRLRISLLKANEAIDAQAEKVGQVEEARLKAARRLGDELDKIVEKRKLDIYVDYSDLKGTAEKIKAVLGEGNIKRNFFNENDTSRINNATEALEGFTKIQDIQIAKLEKVTKAYRDLTQEQKDALLTIQKEQNQVYNNQLDVLIKTATEIGGKAGKDFSIFNQESVQKYIDKMLNAADTTASFEEKSKDAVSKRLALIEKIQKLELSTNSIVLSSREKELESITAKYKDLTIEAKKLGSELSVINRINAAELAEKNVAIYKFDTDALEASLKDRQALLTSFKDFSKSTSIESAENMYAGIIDASKEFVDLIEEEQNKLLSTSRTRDLNASERARYAMLMSLEDEFRKKQRDEELNNFKEVYELTATTEQKISKLREDYRRKQLELDKNFAGQDLANRTNILGEQLSKDIDAVFKNILEKERSFTDVSNMIAGATKSQIRAQIESLKNYLSAADGLTKTQISSIQNTINGLEVALTSATDDGIGKSNRFKDLENESNRLSLTLVKLKDEVKKLKEEFGGIIPPELIDQFSAMEAQIEGIGARIEDIKIERISAFGDVVTEASASVIDLANSFEGVNNGLFKMLGGFGEFLGNSGSILTSFGNINIALKGIKDQGGLAGVFSSGGVGGVVSSLTPIIGGLATVSNVITGIFTKAKERRAQARKEEIERSNNIIRGELEYQALLRQREIQEQRRIKNNMDALKGELEVSKSQVDGIVSSYAAALSKVQSGRISATGDNQLFRLFKEMNGMYSLTGATYEQLEKLFLQGLLQEQAGKDFEALRKVKEEIDALGLSIDDLKNAIDELVTGTSISDLSSAFAELFANGTTSAEDFGHTLENVIKNAIVAGFKANYIDKAMESLFAQLAEAAGDGELTQSEIDAFIREGQKKADELTQVWDRLTAGLDIDFTNNGTGGGAPIDVVRKITESQANSIDGSLKGIQVLTLDSNNVLKNQLNVLLLQHEIAKESVMYLVEIRNNTLATANNTARLESIENSLISIDSTINNRQAASLGII